MPVFTHFMADLSFFFVLFWVDSLYFITKTTKLHRFRHSW